MTRTSHRRWMAAAGIACAAILTPAAALAAPAHPANNRTATVVSFSFRACARPGPVFLRVRTTVAGTGIPGFSS